MARRPRVYIENAPQHIYLESVDSLVLFNEESDYIKFLAMLGELHSICLVDIHSYLLMPKYFEFLLTPRHPNALGKFMQSLSRNYVGYYNKKYSHKGTILSGRYKSSLVEDTKYLLNVMKFIEKKSSTTYKYSSVKCNLFNEDS